MLARREEPGEEPAEEPGEEPGEEEAGEEVAEEERCDVDDRARAYCGVCGGGDDMPKETWRGESMQQGWCSRVSSIAFQSEKEERGTGPGRGAGRAATCGLRAFTLGVKPNTKHTLPVSFDEEAASSAGTSCSRVYLVCLSTIKPIP